MAILKILVHALRNIFSKSPVTFSQYRCQFTLAKKEIAEVGFAEFKAAIISSKDKCIESIKKEPFGS